MNVSQRDLEYQFEVFTLAIEPVFDPLPDTAFEPWPFARWRTQVLRRTEFIIEDVPAEDALGTGPHNMQDACRPGMTPGDASAACEVAVGVLFSGQSTDQLLLAVAWFPFDLIVSRDPQEISLFLEGCEVVDISRYESVYLAQS